MHAARILRLALPLLPLLPLLALSAPVAAEAGFGNLVRDGKPILDLRYRHEYVAQDNALRDAHADTLRARIGYRTGRWHGVSGLVEVDTVSRVDSARHNDTRNGRSDRAVIADPGGSGVNQALLRWDGRLGSASVGRQRVNLDNQRFIGGVGWRQNEQTYDGAVLQFAPRPQLSVTYAWLQQVDTVFGPDDGPYAHPANGADITGDSHLFNMRYALAPQFALTGYQYRLDLDNAAVTASAPLGTLSATTTGLRADGTVHGLGYVIEHARQADRGGNPWQLDSRYRLVELGYTLAGVQLKAGQEVLGAGSGAGNRAFQTPLGTRHAFQGWADVFLTTPVDGLDDRYATASVPLAGGTLQAWYHAFSAERGGAGYGREIDLSYARAVPGVVGLAGLVKVARYDSRDRARTVDTRKVWVQLQYTY
jgi:hypothetical protein